MYELNVNIPKNATNAKVFKGDRPEMLIQSSLEGKTLVKNAEIMLLSENGIYNITKQRGSLPGKKCDSENAKMGLVGDVTYMNDGRIILKKGDQFQQIEYPRYLMRGVESNHVIQKFWISKAEVDRKIPIRLEFGLVYNPNINISLENYVNFWPNEAEYNKGLLLDEIMKSKTTGRYKNTIKSYWYPWHFLNIDAGDPIGLVVDDGTGGNINTKLLKSFGVYFSKLNTHITLNTNENIAGDAMVLPNDITEVTLRKENFLNSEIRDFISDFYKSVSEASVGSPPVGGGVSYSPDLYSSRSRTMSSIKTYASEMETTSAAPSNYLKRSVVRNENAFKKKKLYGLTLKPNPKYILSSKFPVDYILESINVPTLMVNKIHINNHSLSVGDCIHSEPKKVIFINYLDEIRKGKCRVRDEYKEEIVTGDDNGLEISNQTKYIDVNKLTNMKFKICLTNTTKTAGDENGSQTELKQYSVKGLRLTSVGDGNQPNDGIDENPVDYAQNYDAENPHIVYLFIFTEAHSVEIRLKKSGDAKSPNWIYSTMQTYTKKIRNKTKESFDEKYPFWEPFQSNLEEYLSMKYSSNYPNDIVLAPVVMKKNQPVDLDIYVEKYIYKN